MYFIGLDDLTKYYINGLLKVDLRQATFRENSFEGKIPDRSAKFCRLFGSRPRTITETYRDFDKRHVVSLGNLGVNEPYFGLGRNKPICRFDGVSRSGDQTG